MQETLQFEPIPARVVRGLWRTRKTFHKENVLAEGTINLAEEIARRFFSRDCRKDLPHPSPPPPASTGYSTCKGKKLTKQRVESQPIRYVSWPVDVFTVHIRRLTCWYQTAGAGDWVEPTHWSRSRWAPLAWEPPTRPSPPVATESWSGPTCRRGCPRSRSQLLGVTSGNHN